MKRPTSHRVDPRGAGRPLCAACALLAVAIGMHAPRAHGQEADDEAAYQALIDEAVMEFREQRFAEARAVLRRAHELSPSARTLRGIGVASFELRDYPTAYRALSAALVDPRRPLAEEQRDEVDALLVRTRRFLARLRLSLTPPSVELRVDDGAVELDDEGRLLLPLGTHVITARAAGYRPASQTVEVAGGEDGELSFALEPEPPVVAAGGPVASPALAIEAPRPSAAPDLTAPITLLIAGGVLSASVITVGVGWWPERQAQLDACDAAMTRGDLCLNRGELAALRDGSVATTLVLGALSLTALTTGAILMSTSDSPRVSAQVRCLPSVAGLACAGRF